MTTELRHLIGGKWILPAGDRSWPIVNPATESEIGRLPLGGKAELDQALDAADAGFKVWKNVLPQDRAKVVRRFANLMRENVEEIAAAITAEQGKPLAEARGEVGGAAELVEWLSEEGRRTYGRVIPSRFAGSRVTVTHEPVGAVAAFSPWNFPCSMSSRKIAHALAAGCSIILKPAEETPTAAVILGRLCIEAGVPDGVVNIVFGDPAEVSDYLISSPVIQKVSLTGSVPVGKHIAGLAARELKKVTLELGGHSPAIIFNDADVDAIVEQCVRARFRNAGQVCTAPTRFYVQSGAVEHFTERFVEISKSIEVGDGTAANTQMGPLSNIRRVNAMTDFVDDAKAKGASVLCGGERLGNRGFYFAPTVLSDVPDDARIMREEPFGPIAPITAFVDADEALQKANSLRYGLAAYAFTKSHSVAEKMSSGLKAGVVAINGTTVTAPEAPFGGVGDSGIGLESGSEGLLEYMNTKTVTESFK